MLLSGSRCLPSCGANDYQSTFCGRLLSPIVRIPNFLPFFSARENVFLRLSSSLDWFERQSFLYFLGWNTNKLQFQNLKASLKTSSKGLVLKTNKKYLNSLENILCVPRW